MEPDSPADAPGHCGWVGGGWEDAQGGVDRLTHAAVACFVFGAFLSVFVGACVYLVQIQHQRVVWIRFEDDGFRDKRL